MDAMQTAIVRRGRESSEAIARLEAVPAVRRASEARETLIHESTIILDSMLALSEGYPANRDRVSNETVNGVTRSNEEYWLENEGLTSERQFHSKLYYMVSCLGSAYMEEDLGGFSDCLRRIFWVNRFIENEPLQSVYATGLVLGLLNLARYCCDHFAISNGYKIIQHCAMLLEAKRERRAALGLTFRPDSECWYRTFEILAELKWKGPAELKDLIMTPADLATDFRIVEQRCLNYLDRNPSSDSTRDKRVKEALLWSRLQIIKMSIKLSPELTDELIDEFNVLHGALLNLKPGDFTNAAQVDRSQAWFWDFELFKWCVLGPGSEEEAMMCHQWRLDAMRSRFGAQQCLKTYESATKRELEHLLKSTPAQEVACG